MQTIKDERFFQSLRRKVMKETASFYEEIDAAHGTEHITTVMNNAEELCRLLMRKDLREAAIIAAGYHDIFANNRDTHHEDACKYILDNRGWFMRKYAIRRETVAEIAFACREHRNSYQGKYYGKLSEIIAAADRGIPRKGDVLHMAERVYLYGRDRLDLSIEEAIARIPDYLRKRCGPESTGAVPYWYKLLFSEELAERQVDLAKLDTKFFTDDIVAKFEAKLVA